MKKIAFAVLALLSVGAVANGQSVGINSTSIASPPIPTTDSGFIQFNNLTIQSISGTNAPAEIVATQGSTCLLYPTQSGGAANSIACPIPAALNGKPPVTNGAGASGSAGAGTGYSVGPISPEPYIPPIGGISYRIEVSASTGLMLRDRTAATLSSFSTGDQINVFGFYNTDGSIQAYLVRDISKPMEVQPIQLNNVTVVSVSGNMIAVTQTQIAPCYYYNGGSAAKPSICPMGVSDFSANPATKNLTLPQAAMPDWAMLRKYVITTDAQTIFLDKNRTSLSLASIHVGDNLNVYGETSDNGQTVNADIVRDLSIPANTSYTGTITAVNSDGSFVVQTNDGQTITVPNPIKTGVSVKVNGDQITIGGNSPTIVPLPPIPAPAPMIPAPTTPVQY